MYLGRVDSLFVSKEMTDAVIDLMKHCHESCQEIINLVPVSFYNLAEDSVGIGCMLLTRSLERTEEECEKLRDRVKEIMTSRLSKPGNGYSSWNYNNKRNRRDFN